MVLETVVAGLINQFIGDYVDNVETKQLSIGMWQGDVVLHDLRLKKDALDKFNLPVDVVEGYLGELRFNIPWNDLKNKPVTIAIDNLYLLAIPRMDSDYDPEEEEERTQKLKQEKIKAWEMFRLAGKNAQGMVDKTKTAQNATFTNQIVTKIVDNLQVSIKNIHFRYEDQNSDALTRPFSVGFTLSEFSAVSTDNEFRIEKFVNDDSGLIYKLITMVNLSIYWTTNDFSFLGKSAAKFNPEDFNPHNQFLLSPVSGKGKVQIKKGAFSTSDSTLDFETLDFGLDAGQYASLLGLVGKFSLHAKSLKYRKFRPPKSITPLVDPQAWLRYAATCVLHDVHEKRRKWSWNYFEERRNDRLEYIKLYKLKLDGGLLEEDISTFEVLERKLTFRDITLYRSIAESKMKREKSIKEKQMAEAAKSQPQPQNQSWFTGWWYTQPSTPTSTSTPEPTQLLNETQINELYDVIDFDPEAAMQDLAIPKDVKLFDIKAQLMSGSFSLYRGESRDIDSRLASIIFEDVSANVEKYPSSFLAKIGLGGMKVLDGTTRNTLFPNIVKAKLDGEREHPERFFNMIFEQSPLDERADFALSIRMLPLEIIYNPMFIRSLTNFFTPKNSQSLDTLATLQAVAQDTLEGFRSQTRLGLEFAITEHKTLDLKIDVDAPIFIFPQSCVSDDTIVLVIDAGHLLLTSDLVDKETKKTIQYRQETSHGKEYSIEELVSFIYDRFNCKLTSVQVLVGESVTACLEEIDKVEYGPDENNSHLIDRVNLSFLLESCILPNSIEYPRLRLFAKLPLLHVKVSDQKYKRFMSTIDSVLSSLRDNDAEYQTATIMISMERDEDGPRFENTGDDDNISFYDAESEVESETLQSGEQTEVTKKQKWSTEQLLKKVGILIEFEVGEVLLSLQKTRIENQRSTELTLATASVRDFKFKFVQRTFDMNVDLHIGDVQIEDLLTSDPKFRYLFKKASENQSQQVCNVNYLRIDKTSPEFDGITQKIKADIEELEIVLTRSSILALYDFILTTFASNEINLPQTNPDLHETTTTAIGEPLSLTLDACLKRISIIINEDGQRLGTISFASGICALKMQNMTMMVNGKLGSLLLTDDSSKDVQTNASGIVNLRNILTIDGDHVADFRFETFNGGHETEYDSKLTLKASSVRVLYRELIFARLSSFFSEFTKMHLLMESARLAAAESVAQIQETAGRFKFEVNIKTPIVEIPRSQSNEVDFVTLYLGELTASNRIVVDHDVTGLTKINEIRAALSSIKVQSTLLTKFGNRTSTLIPNFNIQFKSTTHTLSSTQMATSIDIFADEIKMQLTDFQYALIAEILHINDERNTSVTEEYLSTDASTSNAMKTDINLRIPCITLSAFTEDASLYEQPTTSGFNVSSQGTANVPLANFHLDNITLIRSTQEDSASDMEISVEGFGLTDTRLNVENKFRDMINPGEVLKESTKKTHMVLLSMASSPSNGTTMIVTVDTPIVFLVMEHLFAVRDFVLSPFNRPKQKFVELKSTADESLDRNPQRSVSRASDLDPITQESNSQFQFRVNIVDLDVILLQNSSDPQTEAILFSIRQLVVAYEMNMTISAGDVGMFFCIMGPDMNDSKLRFIQNFDLTSTIDHRFIGPGHHLSHIVVDFSEIMVRMSYHDMSLLSDILNKFTALNADAQNSSNEVDSELNRTGSDSTGIQKREKLLVNSKGVRVILIDDLTELHLPMLDLKIDPFAGDVSDWSNDVRIDSSMGLQLKYFNIKNSHWEPFVEPWHINFNVSKQDKELTMDFSSKKKLEMNVTHVLIETILNTIDLWNKTRGRSIEARRSVHAPYTLRNRTGYDIHVWVDPSEDGVETVITPISNNEDIPWRFDDWRTMRDNITPAPNTISIQISDQWESLRGIHVDRAETNSYLLRPKINRITHQLVCEVTLKNNVKIVTLRSSSVVSNATKMTVEVMTANVRGQSTCKSQILAPGENFYVPIVSAYEDSVYVRPEEHFGYSWSSQAFSWRQLQKEHKVYPLVTCPAVDKSLPPFVFQINSSYSKSASKENYPNILVKLLPPLQIENLLPFTFKYVIVDRTTKQNHFDTLRNGEADTIHTIDMNHLLTLTIEIPDAGFGVSDVAMITNTDFDYRDEVVTLVDPAGLKLFLRIKYSDNLELGGRRISIYSPYVMLNKTGLEMLFSAKSLVSGARFASGQTMTRRRGEEVVPLMFSYSNSLQNRTQIRVGESGWSRDINFEAVGSSFALIIPPDNNDGFDTHVGITVKEGEGKFFLSKVVTFAPRFILLNNSSHEIEVYLGPEAQQSTQKPLSIKSRETLPLLTLPASSSVRPSISIRIKGITNEISYPFLINQLGPVYIKLKRMGTETEDLMRADIGLENATLFVSIYKEDGKWPFKIENNSQIDITIYQKGSKHWYLIPRGKSLQYALDYPSAPEKTLIVNVNGVERHLDILGIGRLEPMKYPLDKSGTRFDLLDINVKAEGPQLLFDFSGFAKSDPKSKEDPSETTTQEEKLSNFQVQLDGIGISIIDQRMQELFYVSARHVRLDYFETTLTQCAQFRIMWFQVDNQHHGTPEPILVYPTLLPKEGESFRPVFMANVSKLKDSSYGVEYYHWFEVLLQELSVILDEDVLLAMVNFSKFNSAGWDEHELTDKLCDTSINLPTPQSADAQMRMYFEQLILHPVQINISFTRTSSQKPDENERRGRHSNPLTFVFDVFTMTIGNIHDAPVRLNALALEHPIVTPSQLLNQVIAFYTQAVVGQFLKVIGSADFLGNPIGLFNNFSSGVKDFFYEPIQGFEVARPKEIGIGFAKGTASLVKKTVFGVSDTFSKVTGSVGKGLSVMTMDQEFQDQRRRRARNRPKHVGSGVAQGAMSLAQGVASGITGVVMQPLQGAEKEGFGGLVKGLGKGIVGVIAKPVVGVFDMATNVTEGIRNTTVAPEDEIDRQRLPRYIGRNGILTPYDAREALGLNWLKSVESGRYTAEEYIAHLELRTGGQDLVALLTEHLILLMRVKRFKLDWELHFDELKLVRVDGGGISLITKNRDGAQRQQTAQARIIPCPDLASAKWFKGKIEDAFGEYLDKMRPLE